MKPVVYIEWIDACSRNEPVDYDESLEPQPQEGCGFLKEENDFFITIARDWTPGNEQWEAELTVLKSNVTKLIRLCGEP